MSWTEREALHAHRVLSDAGIPTVDDYGQAISLPVRCALLMDERDSLRAELEDLR